MPVYTLDGTYGMAVNISTLVMQVQPDVAGDHSGPLPRLPTAGPVTNVMQGLTHLLAIGPVVDRAVAFGLLTCAAVIYASTDAAAAPSAWIHHSPFGVVTPADVDNARAGMGNPPWASILVIYAHPKPSDGGYEESIAAIVAKGVLANNVVHIPNLSIPFFGINHLGMVGF